MDKVDIEKKIAELEELKIKIKKKKKEVDTELTNLRYKLYEILEEEKANRPLSDTSFLDDPEWSGFDCKVKEDSLE